MLAGTDLQAFRLDSRQRNGPAPSISRIAPAYGQFVPMPALLVQSIGQTMQQLGVYLQDQVRWRSWILTLAAASTPSNNPR